MINFTKQTIQLSQLILDHISFEPVLIPKLNGRITAYQTSPFELLFSLSHLRPGQIDFHFLDLPRASANGQTNLFCLSQEEQIVQKPFSFEDVDYQTTLAANFLVIARLSKRSLSSNGLIAFTTNWQHYVLARAAFDVTFGTKNCLGELVYQTREGGGNDARYMSIDHESVLFYCSNPKIINRFNIPKEAKELKKYNQEDDFGRFTWDTFIRKQAKTYYPIKCPDGSILEYDEEGNKISWLRSRERFERELSLGEIKFELVDGKYKLYYKDRIKDLKILRSVALSKDLGSDVFETLSDSTNMKELLTKHGSTEAKNLNVPYLKSTRFYKLFFNAIGSKANTIAVPFPEHASAVLGLLETPINAQLITTVAEDFIERWEKRVSENNYEFKVERPETITLERLLVEETYHVAANLYAEVIKCRETEFENYDGGSFEIADFNGAIVWFKTYNSLKLVYVGDEGSMSNIFLQLKKENIDLFSSEQVQLFSTIDPNETILSLFSGHLSFTIIPEEQSC